MYKAFQVSPMIPSFNIQETSFFSTDLLEFPFYLNAPGYAVLMKNDLTIHILTAGTDIGEMEFYLEVDDVDIIWSEIKDKMSGIKVREPLDRGQRMREDIPYCAAH